jgi:phosphatidylserine decarboxylase
MPCDGRLTRMIYVPGALFSVNPTTARGVPNLFARNERVVCVFESERVWPFVLVLVGATIVGSMATVWHGVVNPKRTAGVASGPMRQGHRAEEGRGNGPLPARLDHRDAVPANTIAFNGAWAPERKVRLGEMMGNRPPE